jgi:hypothetical protein
MRVKFSLNGAGTWRPVNPVFRQMVQLHRPATTGPEEGREKRAVYLMWPQWQEPLKDFNWEVGASEVAIALLVGVWFVVFVD